MIVEVYKDEMHVFQEFTTRHKVCRNCGTATSSEFKPVNKQRCMGCGLDIETFSKDVSVLRRTCLPEKIYILRPEKITIIDG